MATPMVGHFGPGLIKFRRLVGKYRRARIMELGTRQTSLEMQGIDELRFKKIKNRPLNCSCHYITWSTHTRTSPANVPNPKMDVLGWPTDRRKSPGPPSLSADQRRVHPRSPPLTRLASISGTFISPAYQREQLSPNLVHSRPEVTRL